MVDRFRISVSRKPCVIERNGGYFRTRGTRQICLRGIFGQEDPWSPDDRFGVVWGGPESLVRPTLGVINCVFILCLNDMCQCVEYITSVCVCTAGMCSRE